MKPKWFTKLAGRLLLASTLAVSASCASGPDRNIVTDLTPPKPKSALVEAFNMAAGVAEGQNYNGPAIAHIENSSYLFLNEEYTLHGFAATEILSARINSGGEKTIPVYHLDIDPTGTSTAFTQAAKECGVITIATYQMVQQVEIVEDNNSEEIPDELPGEDEETDLGIERRDLLEKRAKFDGEMALDEMEDLWDESDAVVVVAAGNDGERPAKFNKFLPYMMADSLLLVGSIKPDGRIADYSSHVAPDILYLEAFDQGFRYPEYADPQLVEEFHRQYMNSPPVTPPNKDKAPDVAEGTSFSTPDIGGFIGKARVKHPSLHSNELAVAAMLATTAYTDGPNISVDYKFNKMGLPFDTGNGGHGAFIPGLFNKIVEELESHRKNQGISTNFGRIVNDVPMQDERGRITFEFDNDFTIVRTIGELLFAKDLTRGPIDNFPEHIKVTSPAGTSFNVPLRYYLEDEEVVAAAFSISAFLGESSDGQWSISVPKNYLAIAARLSHTGAFDHGKNTVNWLVDRSKQLIGSPPKPLRVKPEVTQWNISAPRIAAF